MQSVNHAKSRVAGIAIAAALLSLVVADGAFAGPRYGDPSVTISDDGAGGGKAMGTLGGVRNSADRFERLACLVSRSETTSASGAKTRSASVSCSARNTARRTVSCSSTSDALASALSGASNDSLIEFYFNASGQCTDIIVYESASLERKR